MKTERFRPRNTVNDDLDAWEKPMVGPLNDYGAQ